MGSGDSVGQASRFVPERLVAEINARTRAGLELVGMAEHGDSGGAYVRWPDGRDAVVTRSHAPLDQLRTNADILRLARSRGLPVPRHDLLVEVGDGAVAVVQERLPGSPAVDVDVTTIDAMVAVNERFAHLLAERPDIPVPPLHLRTSGPAFYRHQTLEQHSDRSRRLLRRIREIGAAEPHEMTGDDLIHNDYRPENILVDHQGQITGVVDWHVARGDRHFTLVGLLFALTWCTIDPRWSGVQQAAIDKLDDVLTETLEPSRLRLYWAHWTLRQLDLTITHAPESVDLHLHLGESRLHN
ncbi:phosphotransferase family protein [Actinopolymorpha pittospori]|uniref:Aminoglycoside phosphotransferase (APT) family kinase protein n=1 Tax=Actinopolymorpha pittospori TaxID=648752 RepID=A0A927RF75_9ACTN|nr:aminoglycoside phosphotransferase family protein [Actinopolymorpha pittospori]MBE1609930.1 aminoglycoside phosphotransferase (APT) family kinase protein [Actinopolymorpha pittospori]